MALAIPPKLLAIAAVTVAAAIVYSPLVAALVGTGMPTVRPTFDEFAMPLARSAGSAVVAAAVALALGGGFALAVDRARPAVRRICWGLGLAVLVMPPYVSAEAAVVLMGPAGKIARPVAAVLGFGPVSNDATTVARFAVPGFVFTWPAVGVVMGGCLFPIVALAVASAYRRTDRRVFESARLARGRGGVARVAARSLLPPAAGAALLVFAVTLTEFAVPQLLRVRTIGEPIYERIQEGDPSGAAAIGLALLPLVVAAGAVGAFVLARSRSASLAGLEGEVPKFAGRGGGNGSDLLAALMSGAATLPGLMLPIISLTWLAVTAALPPAPEVGPNRVMRASGFFDSLRGAWDLAHDDAIRTVVLAAIAATIATGTGIAVARLAGRQKWGPLIGCLGAALAVPAPVVGLGLIALWDRAATTAVYQGQAVVLLGWLARFLPVAVLLAQAALARVPPELEAAAALAGRGPFGRLIAVVLPAAAPGLVAAWLAVYVLSATEVGATVLVAPPGRPLLAPSVLNLIRRGQDPEIAACQALLLIVVALPLLPLAARIWFRRRRPSREVEVRE